MDSIFHVALVAGAVGWLAYAQPYKQGLQINLLASAAATISVVLSIQLFTATPNANIAFILSTAAIALAASVCKSNKNNFIAVLHVAQCVKQFWMLSNSVSRSLVIANIILHLAVAWMLHSKSTSKLMAVNVYRYLAETYSAIQKILACNLTKDDICTEASRKRYNNIKRSFTWNMDKSFGLLRAILRVAWRSHLVLHIAQFAISMASYYRQILYIQIVGNLIHSSSVPTVQFVQMLVIWGLLFVVTPAEKYIFLKLCELEDALGSIISERVIELYLLHKQSYDTSKYDVEDISTMATVYVINALGLLSTIRYTVEESVKVYSIASMLGWIAIIPAVACVVIMQLLSYAENWLDIQRKDIFKRKSAPRTSLDNAKILIKHMRTVKLYGWESAILQRNNYRNKFKAPGIIRTLTEILNRIQAISSKAITMLTVVMHVYMSKQITYTDLSVLLYKISSVIEYCESLDSIKEDISNMREYEKEIQRGLEYLEIAYVKKLPVDASNSSAIQLDNCEFSWQNDEFRLQPLSLTVESGSFVTITGKVGSGKSSFLLALAGEMPLLSGFGTVKGSIGYVSQKPWIMNATFRQNVLIGHEYEADWYAQVITACALDDDILQLPAADMTEIGHKGINLSGGQKARLALARAIYTRAKVYLLDDVLSAVDAQVERHLVEHVLAGQGILATKTRILVTHAEHIVPLSSQHIQMTDGKAHIVQVASDCTIAKNKDNVENMTHCKPEDLPNNSDSEVNTNGQFNIYPEFGMNYHYWKFIAKFIKYSGYGVVALTVAVEFSRSQMYYFLNNKRTELVSCNSTFMDLSSVYHYLLLDIVVNIVCDELEKQAYNIQMDLWRAHATNNMRSKLINHLVHASIIPFERLSQHTILKMYKNKIESMSHTISIVLSEQMFVIFEALCSVFAIAHTSLTLLVLSVVPAYAIKQIEKWGSRAVETLESSIMRKHSIDLQNSMDEVIDGHEIIRIHGVAKPFMQRISSYYVEQLQLGQTKYSLYKIKRCACQFVDMLIKIVIIIYARYMAVFKSTAMGPGGIERLVDLCDKAISNMSSLSLQAPEIVEELPNLSKYFVYSETLEQEPPFIIESNRPPKDWPQNGAITFKNISLRYRDGLDLVLNSVSLSIGCHEKVGIVGRTGAGKSSLALVLFRLVELAGGAIEIDGIDISTIGLADLRSKLSIVPQDPMLVKGTIRFNLDPGNEFTDDDIWNAIRKACIEDLLGGEQSGLDNIVHEDGKNFSVGQRQQISLCRALLWKRKILVLDEATANIDSATDRLIQTIIRSEFKECTVITIAHRLQSIMDSEKVIVMDKGQAIEYDTPANLLATDSHFARMVASMKYNESTTSVE